MVNECWEYTLYAKRLLKIFFVWEQMANYPTRLGGSQWIGSGRAGWHIRCTIRWYPGIHAYIKHTAPKSTLIFKNTFTRIQSHTYSTHIPKYTYERQTQQTTAIAVPSHVEFGPLYTAAAAKWAAEARWAQEHVYGMHFCDGECGTEPGPLCKGMGVESAVLFLLTESCTLGQGPFSAFV